MRLALAGVCVIALIPSQEIRRGPEEVVQVRISRRFGPRLIPYDLLKLAANKLSVVTVASEKGGREVRVSQVSHTPP
jgi:hypothetical protein